MKRPFDALVAITALMLLSPILLATAWLVKLNSPGPVFYSQLRVGLAGRLFRLYKFRTMVVGADRLGSSVTRSGDPRVTSLGTWLRRAKLDELPQFWNVLIGDMSVVGPRPEVPEIVANYRAEFLKILAVKPGLTSVASVALYDEEALLARATQPDIAYEQVFVPFKVRLGMIHVSRQDVWFDLQIVAATVWRLTLGRATASADSMRSALYQAIDDLNKNAEQLLATHSLPASHRVHRGDEMPQGAPGSGAFIT